MIAEVLAPQSPTILLPLMQAYLAISMGMLIISVLTVAMADKWNMDTTFKKTPFIVILGLLILICLSWPIMVFNILLRNKK